MSPETFVVFSKFHLNTSNSPNIEVVQFVEGHNFHVGWHLRFEVQNCEKAWSTPPGTIHRRLEICQVGMPSCKIGWEKTYRAFLGVAEGWVLYNFCIITLGHFCCKSLRKTWSNCAKPIWTRIGWRPRATSCASGRVGPRRRPTGHKRWCTAVGAESSPDTN
jgi:hypothetical protein